MFHWRGIFKRCCDYAVFSLPTIPIFLWEENTLLAYFPLHCKGQRLLFIGFGRSDSLYQIALHWIKRDDTMHDCSFPASLIHESLWCWCGFGRVCCTSATPGPCQRPPTVFRLAHGREQGSLFRRLDHGPHPHSLFLSFLSSFSHYLFRSFVLTFFSVFLSLWLSVCILVSLSLCLSLSLTPICVSESVSCGNLPHGNV